MSKKLEKVENLSVHVVDIKNDPTQPSRDKNCNI